jgi:hypothetical protein
MERWKLQEMVAMLPLLIQISLVLFAIGLVLFLFHISKPSFGVTTAIFGVGVLYYAITTTISVFVTSSPFHSPLSRTLGKCIDVCMPISVQGLINFYHQYGYYPSNSFGSFVPAHPDFPSEITPLFRERLCRTNQSNNSR